MRSPIVCAFMILALGMAAQCPLSTQLTNSVGCIEPLEFSVNTVIGTAPFEIVVERYILGFNEWLPVTSVTNDADGDLTGTFEQYATGQLRATVTDALGCTRTETNIFQAHAIVGGWVGVTDDVCTGVTSVHFTPAGTNCPLEWLQTHDLIVDGTNLGPVSSTCTMDDTGYWVNQPFSNGPHSISFSGPSCMGDVVQCWVPSDFTVNTYSGDCGVNFYLRAALDGALPSGTLMTDALRAANLVPPMQPYTALGYTFVGSPTNITVAPALLAVTGNNAIVDWLVVELRSATTPTNVVWSKPVLLQRDGDVIDSDGNPHVNVPVAAGNYHIALRHRNHLGVMTGNARALTVDPAANTIDMRIASTSTYGTSARKLKGTVYCLWAGDTNFNGTVKYAGGSNDRDPILTLIGGTTPTNTVNNVYNGADLNLDGTVKYAGSANDRDIILQTVGGSVPTATRTQQLP